VPRRRAHRLRGRGGGPVAGQGVSERGAQAERRGRGAARPAQRQPAGLREPLVTAAGRLIGWHVGTLLPIACPTGTLLRGAFYSLQSDVRGIGSGSFQKR